MAELAPQPHSPTGYPCQLRAGAASVGVSMEQGPVPPSLPAGRGGGRRQRVGEGDHALQHLPGQEHGPAAQLGHHLDHGWDGPAANLPQGTGDTGREKNDWGGAMEQKG